MGLCKNAESQVLLRLISDEQHLRCTRQFSLVGISPRSTLHTPVYSIIPKSMSQSLALSLAVHGTTCVSLVFTLAISLFSFGNPDS
jgi:hypothetical protein